MPIIIFATVVYTD